MPISRRLSSHWVDQLPLPPRRMYQHLPLRLKVQLLRQQLPPPKDPQLPQQPQQLQHQVHVR
jgi:hypothetical protein